MSPARTLMVSALQPGWWYCSRHVAVKGRRGCPCGQNVGMWYSDLANVWPTEGGTWLRQSARLNEICIAQMQPLMFRGNNALCHCKAELLASPLSVYREFQETRSRGQQSIIVKMCGFCGVFSSLLGGVCVSTLIFCKETKMLELVCVYWELNSNGTPD